MRQKKIFLRSVLGTYINHKHILIVLVTNLDASNGTLV